MSGMRILRLTVSKILNHVEPGVAEVCDRHSYYKEKRDTLEAWSHKLPSYGFGFEHCKAIEQHRGVQGQAFSEIAASAPVELKPRILVFIAIIIIHFINDNENHLQYTIDPFLQLVQNLSQDPLEPPFRNEVLK